MGHPMSVKSSKRKGKETANKTMTLEENEANSRSRLESLWEMKKKDIEERNKLSKMEMLRSLLGKTEKLTGKKKEKALKNKLIDEIL